MYKNLRWRIWCGQLKKGDNEEVNVGNSSELFEKILRNKCCRIVFCGRNYCDGFDTLKIGQSLAKIINLPELSQNLFSGLSFNSASFR